MPPAAVAEAARPVRAPAAVRRFDLADLSQHGGWVLPRLMRLFPHLTEQQLAGWLRGIINDNESQFLYQENAIALAQVTRASTLQPEPVIWERFVIARSEQYVKDAAEFYDWFARWAKHHGANVIHVMNQTDVPAEMIQEKLGKLRETKLTYVKV